MFHLEDFQQIVKRARSCRIIRPDGTPRGRREQTTLPLLRCSRRVDRISRCDHKHVQRAPSSQFPLHRALPTLLTQVSGDKNIRWMQVHGRVRKKVERTVNKLFFYLFTLRHLKSQITSSAPLVLLLLLLLAYLIGVLEWWCVILLNPL